MATNASGQTRSTEQDSVSVRSGARRNLAGTGAAVGAYGLATTLLALRASAILGETWAWLTLLLVPILTVLVGYLRTGTALALALVYAFISATALVVQGYQLGWTEVAQVQHIASHFATVFFLASVVALSAQLRSRQRALEEAQELVRRYVSTDETTGLLTIQAFMSAASRELTRSVRTGRPLLLLAIDLSEYFAPGRGSATLEVARRLVADILASQTRGSLDVWTMWQPDIYLGLLTETDGRAVESVLDRVLKRMAQAPEFKGQELTQKARCGFAAYPHDGGSLDALIESAVGGLLPLEQLRRRLGQRLSAVAEDQEQDTLEKKRGDQ